MVAGGNSEKLKAINWIYRKNYLGNEVHIRKSSWNRVMYLLQDAGNLVASLSGCQTFYV